MGQQLPERLTKAGAKLRFLLTLAANHEAGERRSLLSTYARLLLTKKLLVDGLRQPRTHERLLDFEVDLASYRTFVQLFEEIFIDGVYEFQPRDSRPFIVDCGSNIGLASLFFKRRYPEAEILAFEPSPQTFGLLQHNVAQNHLSGVRVVQAAVSNEEGQLPFYYDAGVRGGLNESLRADMGHASVVTVPAVKLSGWLDRPVDLLKLDVEGMASRVLEDLAESGKLALVHEVIIEFERFVRMRDRGIARGLQLLEEAGFDYQLRTETFTDQGPQRDELVFVHAYRRVREMA